MSNSALFGNSVLRSNNKNLVEIKAGKMTMKGKMVYADNRKGQLYIYQSDDSLMHFCWKDRTTGVVEDDLIIFPDDCEFTHVTQCKTGRVYLLKFKSSSRKFFFWLQDLKTDLDEERCKKINEILNNPPTLSSQRNNTNNPEGDLQNLLNNMSQQQLMQLFGGVGHIGGLGTLLGSINRPFNSNRITANSSTTTPSRQSSSISTNSKAEVTSSDKNLDCSEPNQNIKQTQEISKNEDSSQIQLSDLQHFLSEIPVSCGTNTPNQKNLISELSATFLTAIKKTDDLETTLAKYLPKEDDLSTILSSPQFIQALSIFWTAIASGQIGPIIKQFGLGTDVITAATNGNIESFVVSLEEEIKNQLVTSSNQIVVNENSEKTVNKMGLNTDKKDENEDQC